MCNLIFIFKIMNILFGKITSPVDDVLGSLGIEDRVRIVFLICISKQKKSDQALVLVEER